MIDYSDRILFGTDIGRTPPAQIERLAERYFNCFRILETDELVRGSFFGDQETKGLKLPLEVLEKIIDSKNKNVKLIDDESEFVKKPFEVHMVEAGNKNIKIRNSDDFALATALYSANLSR